MLNQTYDLPNVNSGNSLIANKDGYLVFKTESREIYIDNLESSSISLPTLSMITYMYMGTNTARIRRDINHASIDELRVKWQCSSNDFLKYNPEIWLFVYRNTKVRRYIDENNYHFIRKKGWVHPSHLNGIKYNGSKYFSGNTIYQPFPSWRVNGISTEFPFDTDDKNTIVVPVNPYDWFYIEHLTGKYEINASTVLKNYNRADFRTRGYDDYGYNNNNLMPGCKKRFRLAVVIDNPDTNAEFPKVIGPMSDIYMMKLQGDTSDKYEYFTFTKDKHTWTWANIKSRQ